MRTTVRMPWGSAPGWAGIALVALTGAIAGCGWEGGGITVPCPIPPMFAIPWADTIAVGDTVRFRIPASDPVHAPARLIRWSSQNTRVATVMPDSGLARALAIGLAEIDAVDMNTPSNCRASWYGTLSVRAIHNLPPDTLPHSASDSVLAFSVSATALYANDNLWATFVLTNPRSDTLRLQGSGDPSCLFVVRAYDRSGNVASPIEPHACTADIHFWATMPPHASFTQQVVWRANDGRNIGPPPPAPLPAGVYDLEPRVDAVGFLWVGKRVRVQVIVP
jgi:hypothetical protein